MSWSNEQKQFCYFICASRFRKAKNKQDWRSAPNHRLVWEIVKKVFCIIFLSREQFNIQSEHVLVAITPAMCNWSVSRRQQWRVFVHKCNSNDNRKTIATKNEETWKKYKFEEPLRITDTYSDIVIQRDFLFSSLPYRVCYFSSAFYHFIFFVTPLEKII